MRQYRPDGVLEVVAIDGEVVSARLRQRRHTPGIPLSLGPKGQALRVFEIGQRLDGLLRLEVMLEPA